MSSKRTEQDDKKSEELLSQVEVAIKAMYVAIRRVRAQVSSNEFEAAANAVENVRVGFDNLARLAEEIARAECSFIERADRRFLEFETDLRTALAQQRWKVEGCWPSIYVEHGIPVDIDEKSRSVKVGGRKTSTPTVKSVVAALKPLVAGLVPNNFAPQSFIDLLAKAYDDVKGSKSQAPAQDVYYGLVMRIQAPQFRRDARADRFRELTLDQFRARLTRCLECGYTSTTDRRELRMLSPLDPQESIFVYQPAELRFAFVGRIEFTNN